MRMLLKTHPFDQDFLYRYVINVSAEATIAKIRKGRSIMINMAIFENDYLSFNVNNYYGILSVNKHYITTKILKAPCKSAARC